MPPITRAHSLLWYFSAAYGERGPWCVFWHTSTPLFTMMCLLAMPEITVISWQMCIRDRLCSLLKLFYG